ncbi:unnamed protein product, partial [marine sediment metagenome]
KIFKNYLSRSIRSARLTYHFKLTRASEPVYEPYICRKHKNKICAPTTTLLPFIKKYSVDTVKRLSEFAKIRKKQPFEIIHGDSREINFNLILENKFQGQKIDGIICSPPYVGLIEIEIEESSSNRTF